MILDDELAYSIYADGLRGVIYGPTKYMRDFDEILIPVKRTELYNGNGTVLNIFGFQGQHSELSNTDLHRLIDEFNINTRNILVDRSNTIDPTTSVDRKEKFLTNNLSEAKKSSSSSSFLRFGHSRNSNTSVGVKPAVPWSYYSMQAQSNMQQKYSHSKVPAKRPQLPAFPLLPDDHSDGSLKSTLLLTDEHEHSTRMLVDESNEFSEGIFDERAVHDTGSRVTVSSPSGSYASLTDSYRSFLNTTRGGDSRIAYTYLSPHAEPKTSRI